MPIDEENLSYQSLLIANRKLHINRIPEVADETEILAFCLRLKGQRSWDDLVRNRDNTPLPRGFHALRVFDGRDGRMLGASWHFAISRYRGGPGFSVDPEPLTAHTVVGICFGDFLEEIVAWQGTKPLPVSEPGVLDLVVDLETKPREFLYDGTPLTPKLVQRIAQLAPRRDRALKLSAMA